MLELDRIYFLHPHDRTKRTIRMLGPGGDEVCTVSRDKATPLRILIPDGEIEKSVDAVTRLPWVGKDQAMKLYGMIIKNMKATATQDGYIVTANFPPVNSGAFKVGTKNYSLFRDVFIVPHLAREMRGDSDTLKANSHLLVYFSLKDRDGWEIGRA